MRVELGVEGWGVGGSSPGLCAPAQATSSG